ncbi:MAG: hypothetical protein QXL22_01825 [Candidatus Nezhaarchaeales archaeon]
MGPRRVLLAFTLLSSKKVSLAISTGDRGLLDFMVWIIVILDYPGFLSSFTGRFLARLVAKEENIYVKADPAILRRRVVDISSSFLVKEIACYNVLAKYYAKCTIDTTSRTPLESLGELMECLRRP